MFMSVCPFVVVFVVAVAVIAVQTTIGDRSITLLPAKESCRSLRAGRDCSSGRKYERPACPPVSGVTAILFLKNFSTQSCEIEGPLETRFLQAWCDFVLCVSLVCVPCVRVFE